MFNKKYKNRIKELELQIEVMERRGKENYEVYVANDSLHLRRIKYLEDKFKNTSMKDLMIEALGMNIDFSAADEKGKPPHFLDGLSEDERKNFIIDMESVNSNERFQAVMKYVINLFGLNIAYNEDKEVMKHNQMAMIGLRTVLKIFDKMHLEFLSYRKNEDEDFDPLETLPS